MKLLLVLMLAVVIVLFSIENIFAEKPTYIEKIKFIQYLDENTALEEVRNGNLDIYYYRIPSDRLENTDTKKDLNVFESTGGSYSILVNPAETEEFNPFSIKEVRFAINYLIDRKLIVNELMGGNGASMISYYSPTDPEYLTILDQLETYNFRYNPSRANDVISNALQSQGLTKLDGIWYQGETPIEITIFIRSDDPIRKSIGEILASELENIGFIVNKDFGDLNKAFVVVYGSNPADNKWSLYTEGWARSAFVKYDSVGIAQMYAPWFSNMPGFNDPTYWNYQNESIDEITQKIYTGDFNSQQERSKLIQDAVMEGINESVRIFVASKIDQYVTNEGVEGVVNDFGAGVPSRFTPINVKSNSDELTIGVKQIYQGAWNPVMGLSDSYSRQIWGTISDPITFKHPFSGETFPIRTMWNVETAGPTEKLTVPEDAIMWNPEIQSWQNVGPNVESISKVTFDLEFSNWHNGAMMDMNDIFYSLYFTIDWGTKTNDNDKTFDTEFTPRAAQTVETLIGIKQIDENTIEVYVDFWHFDEGEIADWASLWSIMPWEIYSAMEEAVKDGKVSFSRSGATSKNVNWLSLLVPNDAKIIQEYLIQFENIKHKPNALTQFQDNEEYFTKRYQLSNEWIEANNHAVISNGPFYMKNYSPESRTITINAFADDTYPFEAGHWNEFGSVKFPKIKDIEFPSIVKLGTELTILVNSENSDFIRYYIIDSNEGIITSETIKIKQNPIIIKIPSEMTEKFKEGVKEIKIFAISTQVLKPDFFSTNFLVSEKEGLPENFEYQDDFGNYQQESLFWIIIPIILTIGIVIASRKISQRVKP